MRGDRGSDRGDRGRGGRGRGDRPPRERVPEGDIDPWKYDANVTNRDTRDVRPRGLRGNRGQDAGRGRGRGEGRGGNGEGRGGYREDYQRDRGTFKDDSDGYYTTK